MCVWLKPIHIRRRKHPITICNREAIDVAVIVMYDCGPISAGPVVFVDELGVVDRAVARCSYRRSARMLRAPRRGRVPRRLWGADAASMVWRFQRGRPWSSELGEQTK